MCLHTSVILLLMDSSFFSAVSFVIFVMTLGTIEKSMLISKWGSGSSEYTAFAVIEKPRSVSSLSIRSSMNGE